MKHPALRATVLQDNGEFHKDSLLPPSGEKAHLHNPSLSSTHTHTNGETSEIVAEIHCSDTLTDSVQ